MSDGGVQTGKRMMGELPAELRAGATLIQALRKAGTLAEAANRFVITRKPGYLALDGLLFLLCYFSGPPGPGGLRGFYELHREWAPVLGALGGRARLMSCGALSRLLSASDPSGLAAAGRWWLLHASGALEVLRSPAVVSRDAQGAAWHIFDYDPSRQAFRQRALPEDPTLPPGRRRLSKAAAPGYAGRKRGDVVYSESLLQHHGSGIWLDATVQPGNGDPRAQLASALAAVVEVCEALVTPVARALVRTDGQFGNVPSFSAASAAGVAYLSRVSRAELLASPEVRARLNVARWSRVPDSGSGPTRYAADLGDLELPPGSGTLRDDGSPYEPVVVRVVVSRYRASGATKPVGTVIGDEVFECFGSLGLTPGEWPAASIVAAYYGRCAQENRFSQLDREFAAENMWSTTPGGQLFALLSLLYVWNVRVIAGVKAHPPLPARLPQAPWREESSPELPPLPIEAPSPPEARAPASSATEPASSNPTAVPPTDAVVAALIAAGLGAAVARRKGWIWDGKSWYVSSPEGQPHRLISVVATPSFIDIGFRAIQPNGMPTTKTFRVGPDNAAAVHDAWKNRPRHRKGNTRPATAPTRDRGRWLRHSATNEVPRFAPDWPGFQPAAARQVAAAAARRQTAWVDVFVPEVDEPEGHPLVIDSVDRRRRRRLSHDERLARMAAAPGTTAVLRFKPLPTGPAISSVRPHAPNAEASS